MTTWTTRIKLRMKELGMTQEVLAHKMGVTRGAVTHYLAGRRVPPLRQFQKLAAILKADPAWLQFGTPSERKQNSIKMTTKKEKPEPAQSRIPVLSWEQVSEFIGTTQIAGDEIKEYLPNFYTDYPQWYALRIKGDAMTAPLGNSKSFHEGGIIIVDPEKNAAHGSYVIALLPYSKEATFKQYVIDGGVRYLKPLNPQYPITQIDDSTHICGVVVSYVSLFSVSSN
jgi:SOS-response transcriptional repressor LexA